MASSDQLGESSQPPPGAAVSSTPTGCWTCRTDPSWASASASQRGEPIRQLRRSCASKSFRCEVVQRESCAPSSGSRPSRPAAARARSAAPIQFAGVSRSIGSRAVAARRRSSSAAAGTVSWDQSIPACSSARACPVINSRTALSASR
jgi:hypothetical protein